METLEFSVLIFKDEDGNIAVEKRGGFTRNNEGFAFFGGKLGNGKSAIEGLKGKLLEELGYVPDDLQYTGDYIFDISEGKYSSNKILYHTYFAKITKKLLGTNDLVGGEVVLVKIYDAKKHEGFFQGDKDLVNRLSNEGKLVEK